MIKKEDLRIVFMGTPEFAVESLKALLRNNYQVVGVVTSPDKPAGRGYQIQCSAVKQFAMEEGLTVLQPAKLKDECFIEELRALKADLQIVVAFRMLPEIVWDMPRLGTFNLHGSLLPQYRGAAPINWAIINGEKTTGVTTFFLSHDIDTGKIIFREGTMIGPEENAGDIHDRLMQKGAFLVIKTMEAICNENYETTDQEEYIIHPEELKVAPKIFKENCRINWKMKKEDIYNLIRGLSPYPTAWTELVTDSSRQTLKIFSAVRKGGVSDLPNGSILTDNITYLDIVVDDGFISLQNIQLSGKKRMGIEEFLRGRKVEGAILE